MGQMASLLSSLCRRIPVSSDKSTPDRNFCPSQTRTLSETRYTVESDSNESATPDEDDRSHKTRRAQAGRPEPAQIDVHASDDDSVSADINFFTEPQSHHVLVTGQRNEDISDLLDEDETTGPQFKNN